MCGRVTLALDKQMILDILADAFEVTNAPAISHVPNYNLGPSSPVLSIIQPGTKVQRRAGQLTWGFVPPWTKEDQIKYSLINARSETITEKPTFRNSFEQKRCIILADSFYEWKREKVKRPFRFLLKDQKLFPLAGIYTTYTHRDGKKLHTCSILTCQPNELMKPIHNRMPVILTPDSSNIWLSPKSDLGSLKELMVPYDAKKMDTYEVSTFVNSMKNNSPQCIEPVDEQLSLL